MSGRSLKPLQQAIYTALTGDTTLMGMMTGVYDYVPDATAFPYLAFGDISAEDESVLGVQRERTRLMLHTYSRSGGKKQAGEILERVHTVLHHAALSLSGGLQLVSLNVDHAEIRQENDGLTWRGTATVSALVQV